MTAQQAYELGGRICLVTGATSGIGRETALSLARSGATVMMVARDRARGDAVASEIRSATASGSVELLTADLACQGDVTALAAQGRARPRASRCTHPQRGRGQHHQAGHR